MNKEEFSKKMLFSFLNYFTHPYDISVQTHQVEELIGIGAQGIQTVHHEDGARLLELRVPLLLLPELRTRHRLIFSEIFVAELLRKTGTHLLESVCFGREAICNKEKCSILEIRLYLYSILII